MDCRLIKDSSHHSLLVGQLESFADERAIPSNSEFYALHRIINCIYYEYA